MKTTGERFKQIRKQLGLSQEKLGEHLELTKAAISAVEKDRTFVSVKVLSKLFFDYNINLNYLVCGVGEMFNPPKYEDVQNEFETRVIEIMKKQGVIK